MLMRRSAPISQTLGSISPFDGITILIAWFSCIAASLFLLPNAQGIVGGSLAVLMIAIAFVDARRFIIPNELTAAAVALGFLQAAIQDSGSVVEALADAALRGAILALAFLTLRILYRRLRGRDGIGLGDVKLAGVAGVWVDWWMLPAVIEVAALAALAVYAVRYLLGRRPVRLMRLPFGLFLAPAIWFGWLLESVPLSIPSLAFLQ
jgi:leader peptidase (prepilin peptidase) / N-methyltransferase